MNRTRPGRARQETPDVRKFEFAGLRKFGSSAHRGWGIASSGHPNLGVVGKPKLRTAEVTESQLSEHKSRRILKGRQS